MSLLKFILFLLQFVPPLLAAVVAAGYFINRRAERIRRARLLAGGEGDRGLDDGARHPSRIGVFYLAALAALCAFAVWVGHAGVKVFSTPEAAEAASTGLGALLVTTLLACFWLLLLGGLVAPLGLLVLVAMGVTYVVTDRELAITVGGIRRMMRDLEMRPPFASCLDLSIPLVDIVEIRRTLSPVSAPALSMRRLLVRYRSEGGAEEWVIISPKDEGGFIADVCARSPGLRVVGRGRAVRSVEPASDFSGPHLRQARAAEV